MEAFSNVFLTANFSRIVLWTFLHSLWQAAFFAMLAGLFVMVTRRARPGLRYQVLLLIGLSFLLSNGITFGYLLTNNHNTMDMVRSTGTNAPHQLNIQAVLFHFLSLYAHWVLLVWLFGFLIKGIRLQRGFRQVYQISQQEMHRPDSYWEGRFQALSKALKINRKVRLLQSGILTVPTTVGFLKPLVLLPFELLTHLPPDQIEVILLHELAHVKRKDYLINCIQKLIEALFFFNPFLLWMSKQIRMERENCCDEIAMQQVEDKKVLARALVNFETHQQRPIRLAMNFTRAKGQLLNRVKRIVSNENQTLNDLEKLFVKARGKKSDGQLELIKPNAGTGQHAL